MDRTDPTEMLERAIHLAIANVGDGVRSEVRSVEPGQHARGGFLGRTEHAFFAQVHEALAVREAARVAAAQVHLHVGVDDAGRE